MLQHCSNNIGKLLSECSRSPVRLAFNRMPTASGLMLLLNSSGLIVSASTNYQANLRLSFLRMTACLSQSIVPWSLRHHYHAIANIRNHTTRQSDLILQNQSLFNTSLAHHHPPNKCHGILKQTQLYTKSAYYSTLLYTKYST